MEETKLIFNTSKDYAKEFKDTYAKSINLPTTKCLNSFFHPVLRDHIITVNEVSFPIVSTEKVKGLMHNRISSNFEYKMEHYYMDAAGKFQARRRHKLATNLEIEKDSSDYVPYEPSSSIFSDDSYYEGGVHESIRRKMSANKQKIRKAKTQMIRQKSTIKNQSLATQQLTVKGKDNRY
jgi:hypothetical protein